MKKHPFLLALWSALYVLVGSYAITVTGSIILRTIFNEETALVAFINSILHITILPALVLLPVTLFVRRWGLSLLLIPPVIFFAVAFLPHLLPKTIEPPPQNAPQLRIMTFNLLAHNRDFTDVIAILRESEADIIALQEVSIQAADAIQSHLTALYPYQVIYPGGIPGIGILSKYPITDEVVWRTVLQQQRVMIDWNGRDLVVYNVHPMTPISSGGFNGRNREIADILARIALEEHPVLLVGDFNMTDLADPYRDITAQFEDAYHIAGQGIGYTYFLRGIPLLRIDYLFYRAPFRAFSARVGKEGGGSDHRPLIVSLALEQ
ncbi:MAG: hypothetical protein CUN56_04200 [Phototrophicales bacterium]|nr:MAG: hypothetical protein CUN56_04200 [Phototrophicales bacterium]